MCSHPVVAIHPAVGACVDHHRGELLSPLGVSDPGSDGLLQVADVEPDVIPPLEFPPHGSSTRLRVSDRSSPPTTTERLVKSSTLFSSTVEESGG